MRALFLSPLAFGLLSVAVPVARAQTPGTCATGTATKDLDINNVRARLYNTGNLFWRGGANVYNVPNDTHEYSRLDS